MSSNLIKQPYEMILDPAGGGGRAKPVANGKFYVGEIDKDPVANPRTDIAYKDESGQERLLTSPLALNNSGAFVVSANDGTIIQPYMKGAIGFSVLITDSRGRDVYSDSHVGDQGNIADAIYEYTDIVYKASGGKSSVENMIAGIPIFPSVGGLVSTGATTWKAVPSSSVRGAELDNGLKVIPLNGLWVDDWGADENSVLDQSNSINEAVNFASKVVRNEGGGQEMDVITAAVKVGGFYYISKSIDMMNNVDISGLDNSVSGLWTDQDIDGISYPDINPSYYTSSNLSKLFILNTTGGVGRGVYARRVARNTHIDDVRVLGFRRNVHIQDSFTIEIDRCHLAGQQSDNNLLITGSIVGEVKVTNSRLDGSNAANVYWNEADRGELIIRDSAIQFCQKEAILSRSCKHVLIDNVFFESCYLSSSTVGYWVDLQGATPQPFAISTNAILRDCSFAGSTDSTASPAGAGLCKFNVFDHVEFSPRWARHYNGVEPVVTAVKNYIEPRPLLSNTAPYNTGLGVNLNQDEIQDSRLGVSSDFSQSVTKSGLEVRTRNDAGTAWTWGALYKRGSTIGIFQETASPGLVGKPIVGGTSEGAEINDNNGITHFKGKNDGFTFMPRAYANTTGDSANMVVSSSGNVQRSTSSRRWKTNERASKFDTSQVLSLTPKVFDYKDQQMPDGEIKEGQKDCIGFIAEDSHAFAQLDEQGLPEGMNWQLITLALVEEVKKLKLTIEEMKGNPG